MSRQSSATAPLRRAEQPWRSDVRVSDEYTSFATKQTTGGEVWGAARSLQAYLETHPAELAGCRTLLELGSGTGWLGMMVALNVPAVERIYLSEMLDGGAFAWLQHNVALNAALSLRAVRAIPCDWAWFGASGDTGEQGVLTRDIGQQGKGSGDTAEARGDTAGGDTAGEEAADAASEHVIAQARSIVQSTSFDLVIGSDLVYKEEGMRALVRVFAVLAARGVRILYAHTRYRFELLDMLFFEALEQSGLVYSVVDPPPEDADLTSESPPLTELFPEMRCYVFDIKKGKDR